MGSSCIAFTMLRYVPSSPTFPKIIFYCECMLDFLKSFFVSYFKCITAADKTIKKMISLGYRTMRNPVIPLKVH